MPSQDPDSFEREMGCTVAEWLGWLPAAIGERRWTRDGDVARVDFGQGTLTLQWRALPPRQIARLQLPRLWVAFRFEGLAADERARFMRRFDLYMQRGGG